MDNIYILCIGTLTKVQLNVTLLYFGRLVNYLGKVSF